MGEVFEAAGIKAHVARKEKNIPFLGSIPVEDPETEAETRKKQALSPLLKPGEAGFRLLEKQKRKAAAVMIRPAEFEFRDTERQLYLLWKEQSQQFKNVRPAVMDLTQAEREYLTDLKIKNEIINNRTQQANFHEGRMPDKSINPLTYGGGERGFSVKEADHKLTKFPAHSGQRNDFHAISHQNSMDQTEPEKRVTDHGHISMATRLTADEIKKLRVKMVSANHDLMDEVHEKSSLDKDLVMYECFKDDKQMIRRIIEARIRAQKGFDGKSKAFIEKEFHKIIASFDAALEGRSALRSPRTPRTDTRALTQAGAAADAPRSGSQKDDTAGPRVPRSEITRR